LEFQCQRFFIPVGLGNRAVYQEPECFNLRWRPLVAQNHRDFREPEFACGLEAEMPGSLAGRGAVDVIVSFDGKPANTVTMYFC